ncbi:MAG TPA: BMP family ABC transporter substrate-binding protein [Actinoplanes sp.]|nr:BMP family ABC transporter substrate-binding protein [Actinoplanes sp.]
MRHTIKIAASVAAGLALAACGSGGGGSGTTGSSSAAGATTIGFLSAAPRNDGGFTQYGLAGVQAAVQADPSLKLTSIVDSVTGSQAQIQGLESLAASNKIVVADSAELNKAVQVAAAKYPDVRFVLVAADLPAKMDNVSSVSAASGYDAVVAGAVASVLSSSKKLGMISGLQLPATTSWYYGMKQGAALDSPATKVSQTYTGDFNDVGKAKQAAEAMIATGTDQLLADLDSGSQGVYQAAESAAEDVGVYQVFALNCAASKTVVGAGVVSWSSILQKSVADAAGGRLPSGAISYGLKSGALSFQFCPGKGTDAAKALADKVTGQLKAGEIVTGDGVLLARPSYAFTER